MKLLLVALVLILCVQIASAQEPLRGRGGGKGGGGGGGQFSATPLIDLTGTYQGYPGRLYDNSNTPPAQHSAEGVVQANLVQPINGKIVFLSIGMSNTSIEWCDRKEAWPGLPGTACTMQSFGKKAWDDPDVEKITLEVVNGAQSGKTADKWANPNDTVWSVVNTILLSKGLLPSQVQVVWMKHSTNVINPDALPDPSADAFNMERYLGDILRNAKDKFPNLRLAFLSSRIYAGYKPLPIRPDSRMEPWAYETGFSVKWVIAAQISQLGGGPPDPDAGDLSLAVAPLLLWGSYLWADGSAPNSEGLFWVQGDYAADLIHPSVPAGQQKVAEKLLSYFKASQFSKCWFIVGGVCQ